MNAPVWRPKPFAALIGAVLWVMLVAAGVGVASWLF